MTEGEGLTLFVLGWNRNDRGSIDYWEMKQFKEAVYMNLLEKYVFNKV